MFADAGVGELRRAAASQLVLDDRHIVVSAEWVASRDGAAPLALKSTFLLRREDGQLRIVVYLNHNDLHAVLADPTAATGS
ncbi:hypothetical protein EBN03_32430 [Nocardia stercoris]|uniref:SnoaL-like domain-containing protein n=2 Tax=Nocardia stercoris TaxID=2483361 RepID=A0A3M2KQV9_9NOCA|nr:hypothetical protein EBN03_32430 [Nocardia stercoris]